MDYTQNLHLPQWEETDRIHHDDFNDAFAAIDAAADKLYFGSYVGDGETNRTIQLPFAPRLALVFGHYQNSSQFYVCLPDTCCEIARESCTYGYSAYFYLQGSSLISTNANWSNVNGKTVYYVLVK